MARHRRPTYWSVRLQRVSAHDFPHRPLDVDEKDTLIDMAVDNTRGHYGREADFVPMLLEIPEITSIQQAQKESRIAFTSFFPPVTGPGPTDLAIRRERRRGGRQCAPKKMHGDEVMKVIRG